MLILLPLLSQAQQRTFSIEELFRVADENNKCIAAFLTGIDDAEKYVQIDRSERLPSIEAPLSLYFLGNGYIWDRNFSNRMSIDIPHFSNNFSDLQIIGNAISHAVDRSNLNKQMAELDFSKNRQEFHLLITDYYLDIYKISNQIDVFYENIQLPENLIQVVALTTDFTYYETTLKHATLNYKITDNRNENNIALITDMIDAVNAKINM